MKCRANSADSVCGIGWAGSVSGNKSSEIRNAVSEIGCAPEVRDGVADFVSLYHPVSQLHTTSERSAATAERRAGTESATEGYGPGEVHPLGRLLKAPGNGADTSQSST